MTTAARVPGPRRDRAIRFYTARPKAHDENNASIGAWPFPRPGWSPTRTGPLGTKGAVVTCHRQNHPETLVGQASAGRAIPSFLAVLTPGASDIPRSPALSPSRSAGQRLGPSNAPYRCRATADDTGAGLWAMCCANHAVFNHLETPAIPAVPFPFPGARTPLLRH